MSCRNTELLSASLFSPLAASRSACRCRGCPGPYSKRNWPGSHISGWLRVQSSGVPFVLPEAIPQQIRSAAQQGIPMKCLWIARYIPYPMDAGAKVYSAKLAESLAGAGAAVRFLGFGSSDAATGDAMSGVEWIAVPDGRRSELLALFSRLPNAAAIDATNAYKALLDQQLREHWDAIV